MKSKGHFPWHGGGPSTLSEGSWEGLHDLALKGFCRWRRLAKGLMILLLVHITVRAETVTIALNDYEPYTKLEHGKEGGLIVELVDAAFGQVGIKVAYIQTPWRRAYTMALTGEVDVTMPYYKTRARELECLYSEPVFSSNARFFIRTKGPVSADFSWSALTDFKPFKVGGALGYWYEDEFKEAGIPLDTAKTDDQAIEKLFNRRIDLFLSDELRGWALINKHYPEATREFQVLKQVAYRQTAHLVTGKKNVHGIWAIKQFNAGLKQLIASGGYATIITKYTH